MATTLVLRDATRADLPVLRTMLTEAAYWRAGRAPRDVDAALARPDLAWLLDDWGRPGDTGVIAVGGGAALGAAWYRRWTSTRHSYGFVDPATPELAIGVVPGARGGGLGTLLLTRLLDRARHARLARLSLSVEADNPALRLYERMGFRRHARMGGAWTMVRRLA